MKVKGLFIGITTVDMHFLVHDFPQANLKINAAGFGLSTGGPATNAAVAFAYLGGQSCLCSAIGEHAFTAFMRQELQGIGIELLELAPDSRALPPFSSIITTEGSGDRAVVAFADAKGVVVEEPLPAVDVAAFDVLLVDGLQMPVSRLLCAQAKEKGIPVLLDAGSWKEGMDSLLKVVDVAICSADFRPPGSPPNSEPRAVLDYLAAGGVKYAAITRGESPILFYDGESYGEIPVEQVKVVDTLGAGDIFHGAFCYYFARVNDFAGALRAAAQVAGRSCEFFGTREWGRKTTNK